MAPVAQSLGRLAAPSQMRRRVAVAVFVAAGIALLLIALNPPHADRLQTGAEQEDAQPRAANIAELARHLQHNPSDARAHAIYGRLQAEHGEYAVAESAFARAVAIRGSVAQDPMIWCEYADVVAMTNGGRLTGRPETLIARALQLNPRHPRALEMAGSAAIERGRYAEALGHWEQLLALLPVDAPQHRELLSAIERTRMRSDRQ